MFGSLNTINCFAFESFLGRLKSSLRSVHKPFQEICQRVFSDNENSLISAKLRLGDTKFGTQTKKSGKTSMHGRRSFAMVVLFNGCVVKRQSMADSTVRLHQALHYVHDVFQDSKDRIYLALRRYVVVCNLFTLRRYVVVCNLFSQSVESMSAGIFKINNLRDSIEVIQLNNKFKKYICLPRKCCMVAIDILHTCAPGV